jgi:hypothetical protein
MGTEEDCPPCHDGDEPEEDLPAGEEGAGVEGDEVGAFEGEGAVGFALFLLVNALLLLRPVEVFPALGELHLYEVAIVACFILSLPRLIGELGGRGLASDPRFLCMAGLLVAIVLSHLANGAFDKAVAEGWDFTKTFLYFVLLLCLVTSPGRLRALMLCVAFCTACYCAISVLEYHKLIDIPARETAGNLGLPAEPNARAGQSRARAVTVTRESLANGDVQEFQRLNCGFYDPNDFAQIAVVGIGICVFALACRTSWLPRLLWVAAVALLGYAFALTYSRGGFLALLAGAALFLLARFRSWKALALAGVMLPVLIVALGGRQTEITTSNGSGQGRIQLWANGFESLKSSPVFGIGMREYEAVAGQGHVAHNSFVQAYTELGLVGGGLFTTLLVLPLAALWKCRPRPFLELGGELGKMQPFLLAIMGGYVTGMMALSRCSAVQTYMLVGMAIAFLRMVEAAGRLAPPRLGLALLARAGAVNVVVLGTLFVFVRLFVHY